MQSATRDSSAVVSPSPSAAKPRGWWRRNWKRLFLAVFVLAALGVGGAYYYKCGRILISEPYHQALAAVQKSPEVKQLLGEPIKDGWFPSGNVSSEQGEARVYFNVRGPKTADGREPTAKVNFQARFVTGEWGFTNFEVTQDGGERLNLTDEVSAAQTPDVKPFDPKTVQPAQPKTDATPPPDVEIKIPDLPTDSGGK